MNPQIKNAAIGDDSISNTTQNPTIPSSTPSVKSTTGLTPEQLQQTAIQALKAVNEYHAYLQKDYGGDNPEASSEIKLRLFAEYLFSHCTQYGLTAWEFGKLVPLRDKKTEDLPTIEGVVIELDSAPRHRNNPEGSIGSTLSMLRREGFISHDGIEKRVGGYGKAQIVSRWVDVDKREEAAANEYKRQFQKQLSVSASKIEMLEQIRTLKSYIYSIESFMPDFLRRGKV